MRWLLIVGTICFIVAATPIPAEAIGSGSLDAYRLQGILMVDGGAAGATATRSVMDQCPMTHAAIERYLHAAPWIDPPGGTAASMFAEFDHESLNAAEVAMVNLWAEASGDGAHLEVYVAAFCSILHQNGWLAVPASIVNLITNPSDLVTIGSSGNTTCDFGELLLGSASYGYRWDSGEWVYGFGTDWYDVYDNFDGTVSSNIDLACARLFEPSDIAQVAEATPDTQVNVNPALKGLTQLDHWLWYDFSDPSSYQIGPLTASVNALGFTWNIETNAWVDQVMWDVDCVSACAYRGMAAGFATAGYEYVLDQPDTELAPAEVYDGGIEADGEAAFEHIYTQLGDVTISTAAVWRGTYIVTNNLRFGSVSFPVLYDPVVVANTHSMPVVAVRAELRNEPAPSG